MSNEIRTQWASGLNLYALIRTLGGTVWKPSTTEWVAWVNGNIDDYDIPLNDRGGGYYEVDFPAAIAAGVYAVQVRQRAGAAPAIADEIRAAGLLSWSGAAAENVRTATVAIGTRAAPGDILATPANKLATDEDGKVTAGGGGELANLDGKVSDAVSAAGAAAGAAQNAEIAAGVAAGAAGAAAVAAGAAESAASAAKASADEAARPGAEMALTEAYDPAKTAAKDATVAKEASLDEIKAMILTAKRTTQEL